MKKIIALALALIMALSMASVAFAAYTAPAALATDYPVLYEKDANKAPGEKVYICNDFTAADKKEYSKVSYDFTSAKYDFDGASMIESIEWVKDTETSAPGAAKYDLVLTLKESLTSTTAKEIAGIVTLTAKTLKEADGKTAQKVSYLVTGEVKNAIAYVEGAKKADGAIDLTADDMKKNTVMFAEDASGYVAFEVGDLSGIVNLAKDEKAQVYTAAVDADTKEAIEAYLGEDYDGIVEYYNFEGTGFKNDVDFQYDAYEEDPHFFYAWNGEAFEAIEAKYDADEDVDNYVFTAPAKGIIVVTDVEIVAAAEETKNPDTGANDVVGVAAALAVVSLVAAGAVSLKK